MKKILSIICITLFGFYGNAQGGMVISSGTQLVCQGDVKLVVTGDFVNNGVFNSDNEVIYFSGSNKQFIGGSGTNSFYGFELNNAAGLDLGSNVEVTNILNLSNGHLDLTNFNMTLGGAINAVNGTPSESNMIVSSGSGEIRKRFTEAPVSDDSDAFIFPVGTNNTSNEYTPVIMNFQSANFGADAYVSVTVDDAKNPFLSPDVSTYIDSCLLYTSPSPRD